MKCEEANHVCDKNQYHEATLWEKLKLSIHLLYCSYCRKYVANNKQLTKMIKESDIHTLPEKEKEELEQKLRQEIAKK
ncbi:MAG: hypothetical protein ACWA45_10755 [Flavobacteriales bacterium]